MKRPANLLPAAPALALLSIFLISLTVIRPRPESAEAPAIEAAGRGNPWMNQADGEFLPAEFGGPAELVRFAAAGLLTEVKDG